MDTQFSEWLALTMESRGLSGKSVAEGAGVSDAQVSRWKRGRGRPSAEACTRLADFFQVDRLQMLATAGRLGSVFEVEPLPIPPPSKRREAARREIEKIKFATEEERQIMLEAFDRGTAEP